MELELRRKPLPGGRPVFPSGSSLKKKYLTDIWQVCSVITAVCWLSLGNYYLFLCRFGSCSLVFVPNKSFCDHFTAPVARLVRNIGSFDRCSRCAYELILACCAIYGQKETYKQNLAEKAYICIMKEAQLCKTSFLSMARIERSLSV